jgi:hypothetical protein
MITATAPFINGLLSVGDRNGAKSAFPRKMLVDALE